jgi:hypothetical protein
MQKTSELVLPVSFALLPVPLLHRRRQKDNPEGFFA